MRDDGERLRDILEAIERIDRYTASDLDVLDESELIQNWVTRHLQIIGEACRHLNNSLREQYPDIPWQSIIGMRNILVHEYFEIDLDAVKAVLKQHLPILRSNVRRILEDLP